MKTNFIILLLFTAILFWSCQRDAEIQPKDYPFIVTNVPTQIDSTGATFNGEILYFGKDEIIDYGFTWTDVYGNYLCSIKNKKKITDFSFRITCDLIAGQNIDYRAFVKTSSNTIYGNILKFVAKGSDRPVIKDFFPKSADDGDLVSVIGSNLSFNKEKVKVYIGQYENTNEAEVIFSSGDSIVFKVQNSSLTGEHLLRVDIDHLTLFGSDKLKIIGPEIESTSINQGYAGDYIAITGKNFTNNRINPKLFFGYSEAEILSFNDNEIKAIVPSYNIFDFLVNADAGIEIHNGRKKTLYPNKFKILSSWEIKKSTNYNTANSQIFTYNNQAYILEQWNPAIHIYNPKEDVWKKEDSSKFPNPTERSLHIVIADNLYLVGGYVWGYDQYKELWVFSIESKKWTRKGDLPFSFLTGTYFFQNNQTHIITDKGEHWQCDFINERYVRLNDFPVKFENSFAYSFISHNIPFTAIYGRTFQYESANDKWIEKAGNPIEKGYYSPHAVGFTYKNSGYIYDTEEEYIFRYDALEDRWIKTCYVPVSLYNHPQISIFLLNDMVYFEDVNQNNIAMFAYKNH